MPSNFKALAGAAGGGDLADPNFKNVTLLLHGDGSNGAQNNTFIDSSTNNFTITRNGNTTQGSFSPYGSNWSNYFDGSTGYLTLNAQTALSYGTGDFTLEAWVFPTSINSGFSPVLEARASSSAQTYAFGLRVSGGVYKVELYTGTQYTGSTTVSLNTWTHIAVTRSSGTLRIFVNGVLDTSWSSMSTSVDANASGQRIGVLWDGAGFYFSGYISNFRAVKGTAVYTSAFTPSTTPLTAITNTSLLTCAYNRFRDGSTNNFTITRNGDVKVTNFAPFAPSVEYSTTTNGGSAYFDGSGDYLAMPSNAAFGLGSGDFTVECWVNPSVQGGHGSSNNDCIIDFRPGSNGAYGTLYIVNNGSGVNWYANTAVQITGGPIPNNAWTHLAVSRVSGNTRLFINGVQSGGTYSDGTTYATTNPWIGQFNDGAGSGWFQGYISNFRILKGTGLYSGSFTPPTAPLTAVTNTQFLLNATNAAIFDNSMKNDLETVGNAQISTSVKKFGTGSMYFDGNGDYLTLPPNSDSVLLGAGSFTIEFWINPNSSQPSTRTPIVSFGNGFTTNVWAIQLNNTSPSYVNRIQLWSYNLNSGAVVAVSTGTISASTWTHVAVVRNGSSITIYINGVADGTGSSSASMDGGSTTLQLQVGYNSPDYYAGYIDDLRITKGVARYTANFTAPTAPFPNK